jgi:hypothetical protein
MSFCLTVQVTSSLCSQDNESQLSDCYVDYEKLWEMEHHKLAECASEMSVSYEKTLKANETTQAPMGSVPVRKFSIGDFNLLKVLGRGSFGKVRDSKRSHFDAAFCCAVFAHCLDANCWRRMVPSESRLKHLQ